MTEDFFEGNILTYGAGGTSEAMECMLKGSGYGVVKTEDRRELLAASQREDILLFLVYFGEKPREGTAALECLTQLRRESRKPVIAQLGGGNQTLGIRALNAGADDVLDQRCSLLESVARVQAQLRGYRRLTRRQEEKRYMKLDGLELDDMARQVSVKGSRVDLTPTEYNILRLLLERPGRVLSNSQIYERIWKESPIGSDNTVAVHIRHIREKIEENPQEPRYLQVVWGQGYKVCC